MNYHHGQFIKNKEIKISSSEIRNQREKFRGKKISNLNIANKILSILDDAKAENLKVIDLSNKSSIADSFIIATCRSIRHADSTADELVKKLKK